MPKTTLSYTDPTTSKWTTETVLSIPWLEERLRVLERSHVEGEPYIGVILNDDLGQSLLIALTGNDWLLIHDTASRDCMHHSLGDENADGEAEYYVEEWESTERRHLIPQQYALKAVREWIESGALPRCVKWEAQPY